MKMKKEVHPHVDFARGLSGYYSDLELELLRRLTEDLEDNSIVVEIGVLYGKSASIFLQSLRERPLQLFLIDPWVVNESDAKPAFENLMKRFPPFVMLSMTSREAADRVPDGIDLLHIDGDHGSPGVDWDCTLYLPKLKRGGVVVFHDYADSNFPAVTAAVDKHTSSWIDLGLHNNQAKRKKP